MRVEVEVPEYDPERGVRLMWDGGFEVGVRVTDGGVWIGGNAAGLRSLARHLLTLAQEGAPAGRHVHLDDRNALDDGSAELTIERR